jgi:hypothetical protein
MEFAVSASGSFELGLDWVALLRDSFIGLGHQVDSSFDAGQFLSDPVYCNNHCVSHFLVLCLTLNSNV